MGNASHDSHGDARASPPGGVRLGPPTHATLRLKETCPYCDRENSNRQYRALFHNLYITAATSFALSIGLLGCRNATRSYRGVPTMRVNHVRRRLAAGEPSIGTWLSLPSPEAAEYISELAFDWLVVDTEHNPIDINTLARMFAAMRPSGI